MQPVLMTLVFDRVAFVRSLTHETVGVTIKEGKFFFFSLFFKSLGTMLGASADLNQFL